MLVLSCTAVIDCFFSVLCTLYFVFFFVFLDLLLCVFSNLASGLQICYNKVE